MTALEYMQRQVLRHKFNYQREFARSVPTEQLRNIEAKIRYYEEAVEALSLMHDQASAKES